jgi:GIY-YIG catalytic domain-containing protein
MGTADDEGRRFFSIVDGTMDSNSDTPVSGIYQIRNWHTGRVYIGKSADIRGRWLAHRAALDRGLHVNSGLQSDWEVYGADAFDFVVLEVVTGHRARSLAEAQHWSMARDRYNVVTPVAKVAGRTLMDIAEGDLVTVPEFVNALYDGVPISEAAVHTIYSLAGITGKSADASVGTVLAAALAANFEFLDDFAIFQDWGYRGLYAGETARDIAARKGLARGQHILDWMGSEELAANWFRITQAEAKLRREGVTDKADANATHHAVGREVRETIQRLGGTMPEQLPTPAESIVELQRHERQRLDAERQPSLFADADGEEDRNSDEG